MIGDRIKAARLGNGLSLRGLADKIGVSHSAIQKYEKNQDIPRSTVLLRLAKVLDVSIDYFFRESRLIFAKPLFRKNYKFGRKKQLKAIMLARNLLERYLFVEQLVPHAEHEFKMPKCMKNRIRKIDDIEDLAVALRKEWHLGINPIPNLIEELESRCIKIVILDINDAAFDGFCVWVNGTIPVIGISRHWKGDRQRYTIAHELGHLLISNYNKSLKEEAIAHRFAGAFLIVRDCVFREIGYHRSSFSLRELQELKIKYGISMQCWIRRIHDLGIISKSKYRSLNILFSQRGWRVEEPGRQVEAENPLRLERLVYRSLIENTISESKAAEILDISISAVRERMVPIKRGLIFGQAGS